MPIRKEAEPNRDRDRDRDRPADVLFVLFKFLA